ncbi:malto-oligosyltrehalose trehalohydrolase [soil metagenome]
MATLCVWAPAAVSVEAVSGDDRCAMSSEHGGWWTADMADLTPGSDYAFSLDGGEPLPDPRSASQPAGVHGSSRLLDHDAFSWHDAGWQPPALTSGLIYELHVGTFTPDGTCESAIERLDQLVDLGVTHVELMPLNAFSGDRGWGYDGVDIFAPHAAYGGPWGLKRLVDACHMRGLAVLIDVVYNHFGPEGNYLARFGPYFTDRYATPWGQAVNFDGPDSDEVRRFVVDNALGWLRHYHADGLRIDAVHAILDSSATHILEELAAEVAALSSELGRDLVLIGESNPNDPRLIRPSESGGYGLHAQWSDDFHHALHSVLTGERDGYYADFGSLAQLATALEGVFVYAGQHSPFRRRRHGRRPAGLSADRFLGYLQNHDQVGNRATGQRSGQLMTSGRLKIGAALVLTAPFVPMLFQGEEWGATTPFLYFTDHRDTDLARAVSDGRRREFQAFGWDPDQVPDPQAPETFERSKLDWSEVRAQPHADLLAWHRALIGLRQSRPELHGGLMDDAGRIDGVEVGFDDAVRWLTVARPGLVVVCNLGPAAASLALPHGAGRVLLASDPAVEVTGQAVSLPPDTVALLERTKVEPAGPAR